MFQGFYGLSRLLKEFKTYKTSFIAILFLGFIVSAVQPLCVKLSENIIDGLKANLQYQDLVQLCFYVIGLFLIGGVAKYLYQTLRRLITERIVLKLRAALFSKMVIFPQSYVTQKRAGDTLSILQNDLNTLGQAVDTICDALKEPFTFLGLLAVAFYCDWKLTLMTLLLSPLVVLMFSKTGAAVKRYTSRNLNHFSDLISLSQEVLVGSPVVKIFQLEENLKQKFLKIQQEYFKNAKKTIKVQELATPSVEFIGALIMAGVLLYGGLQITKGELSTGKLIAFVIAIGLCQMPIKKLNNTHLKLKAGEAATERIYKILDLENIEHKKSISKNEFLHSIEFKNVGLIYSDHWVLKNISLKIYKGERIAFVGPSGSGKSSLVNLLPRFFEPKQGEILVDGIAIQKISLSDLRSLISYVTQETFLFHDTLYENVRYGKLSATSEEILQACELAYCNEFIKNMPHGLNTVVGDRGQTLSGGERQRIAIARAILKNSPILILDEATSNLDTYSEKIVQKALETLMKDKTTLMVAHRLSTIQNSHRIYVMNQGEICEQGDHKGLLSLQGRYLSLLQTLSM